MKNTRHTHTLRELCQLNCQFLINIFWPSIVCFHFFILMRNNTCTQQPNTKLHDIFFKKFLRHMVNTYIHTYIIGYYNPSVWIIYLASHTTYVVYVIFIRKCRDLQFKVDSERQIFDKLFITILFTLTVFARNLLRGIRPRNTFCILF